MGERGCRGCGGVAWGTVGERGCFHLVQSSNTRASNTPSLVKTRGNGRETGSEILKLLLARNSHHALIITPNSHQFVCHLLFGRNFFFCLRSHHCIVDTFHRHCTGEKQVGGGGGGECGWVGGGGWGGGWGLGGTINLRFHSNDGLCENRKSEWTSPNLKTNHPLARSDQRRMQLI